MIYINKLLPFGKRYPYEYQQNPQYRARRRVYDIQCKTWKIAKDMLNIRGDAIRCDIEQQLKSPDPIFLFRAKREYRTDAANTLRRIVAFRVRWNRRSKIK